MPQIISIKPFKPQKGGGEFSIHGNYSGNKPESRLVLLIKIKLDDGNVIDCVMKIFNSHWVRGQCLDNLIAEQYNLKVSDDKIITVDTPILSEYRHEEYIYKFFKKMSETDPIVNKHVLKLLGSGELDITGKKVTFQYDLDDGTKETINTVSSTRLWKLLSRNGYFITEDARYKWEPDVITTLGISPRDDIILKQRYILTQVEPNISLGNTRDVLRDLNNQDKTEQFMRSGIEVLNHLYNNYQFCHWDLHMGNYGIDTNDGSFIIFDFDLATINIPIQEDNAELISYVLGEDISEKEIITSRLRDTDWIHRAPNIGHLININFKKHILEKSIAIDDIDDTRVLKNLYYNFRDYYVHVFDIFRLVKWEFSRGYNLNVLRKNDYIEKILHKLLDIHELIPITIDPADYGWKWGRTRGGDIFKKLDRGEQMPLECEPRECLINLNQKQQLYLFENSIFFDIVMSDPLCPLFRAPPYNIKVGQADDHSIKSGTVLLWRNPLLPSQWTTQKSSSTGKEYFLNTASGDVQWTNPNGLDIVLKIKYEDGSTEMADGSTLPPPITIDESGAEESAGGSAATKDKIITTNSITIFDNNRWLQNWDKENSLLATGVSPPREDTAAYESLPLGIPLDELGVILEEEEESPQTVAFRHRLARLETPSPPSVSSRASPVRPDAATRGVLGAALSESAVSDMGRNAFYHLFLGQQGGGNNPYQFIYDYQTKRYVQINSRLGRLIIKNYVKQLKK